MEFTFEILAALLLVAFIAGLIDSVAGGGGLIVLPVLMLMGLPPLQAVVTNKIQAIFSPIAATLQFHKQGMLD